jgi:hypothetical protein
MRNNTSSTFFERQFEKTNKPLFCKKLILGKINNVGEIKDETALTHCKILNYFRDILMKNN